MSLDDVKIVFEDYTMRAKLSRKGGRTILCNEQGSTIAELIKFKKGSTATWRTASQIVEWTQ